MRAAAASSRPGPTESVPRRAPSPTSSVVRRILDTGSPAVGFLPGASQSRYSVSAFAAESRIPLIIAELNPWCSISLRPAMVQPRGVVT